MNIAQISLDRMPIIQSKDFLRTIYDSEIKGERWFDVHGENSFKRKEDLTMTLGRFLSLNWAERQLRLQIGSPDANKIRYCAAITDKKERITSFAFLECSLTVENYIMASKIFNNSYGRDLETELSLLKLVQ